MGKIALADRWKRRLSYLWPQQLERAYSPQAGWLEVSYEGGQKVLNGPRSNYSHGRLARVWKEAIRHFQWKATGDAPVLVLGLGGGSLIPLIRSGPAHPPITAVENDPTVLDLGKRHFPEHYGDLNIFPWKVAAFWNQASASVYQAIFVDIFVDDTVPEAVRSAAFIKTLREYLGPSGRIFHNLMLPPPQEKEIRQRYEQQIGPVRTFRKYGSNVVLEIRAVHGGTEQ